MQYHDLEVWQLVLKQDKITNHKGKAQLMFGFY